MSRVFRCYAEQANDGWEAICLDLDIAVQGDSFAQVYDDLQKALALYLETISELPAAERERLFERPAPLRLRWRFLMNALRMVVRDSNRERAEFTLLSPA